MTTPTPPPPPPPPVPPAPAANAPAPPPLPAAAPAAAGGGASAATVALAAIGAVVVVGVAVIGGLAVFGGSDSAATDEVAPTSIALRETVVETTIVPVTTEAVVTTVAPAPETTIAPVTTVAPSTTAAPVTTAPPTTATPVTTAPANTAPPTTVAPVVSVPDSTPSDPNVEESKAVVRNGQIYLTGAVPTAEAGLRIEALAAEILGPQNVFNEYVVDPGAGDPNLGNITVEDTITFASNSAFIQESSETLLNQGLALLTIRPAMTITIVGHTDARGTDASNLELSQARADAVKQWFVDRGIDANRLAALGRGSSEPIATNDTAEGQRLNRRIQFFLENILGE